MSPVPLHAAHNGRGEGGGKVLESETRLGRGRGERGRRKGRGRKRHRKALKFLEHAATRKRLGKATRAILRRGERGEGREEGKREKEAVQRHRKAL